MQRDSAGETFGLSAWPGQQVVMQRLWRDGVMHVMMRLHHLGEVGVLSFSSPLPLNHKPGHTLHVPPCRATHTTLRG